MKENFNELMQNLNKNIFGEKQYYTYNRDAKLDESYRTGALEALKYLDKLTGYYIDFDKQLKKDFVSHLEKTKEDLKYLKNSPKKQAKIDLINYAIKKTKDISETRVSEKNILNRHIKDT